MTATVETPWGTEPLGAPDQHARAFAFAHYQAGHRYTVTGDEGSMSIECECGKRYVAGSNTVEYP